MFTIGPTFFCSIDQSKKRCRETNHLRDSSDEESDEKADEDDPSVGGSEGGEEAEVAEEDGGQDEGRPAAELVGDHPPEHGRDEHACEQRFFCSQYYMGSIDIIKLLSTVLSTAVNKFKQFQRKILWNAENRTRD